MKHNLWNGKLVKAYCSIVKLKINWVTHYSIALISKYKTNFDTDTVAERTAFSCVATHASVYSSPSPLFANNWMFRWLIRALVLNDTIARSSTFCLSVSMQSRFTRHSVLWSTVLWGDVQYDSTRLMCLTNIKDQRHDNHRDNKIRSEWPRILSNGIDPYWPNEYW